MEKEWLLVLRKIHKILYGLSKQFSIFMELIILFSALAFIDSKIPNPSLFLVLGLNLMVLFYLYNSMVKYFKVLKEE